MAQVLRRAATSGRSRSLACAVFLTRHDQVVAEHRDHDIDPARDHDVYGHKWLFIKWVHRQSLGVCELDFSAI